MNRSTLLKEVDTDTAHLLEQVADLDDLVQQFDTTDAGKRFIEAWKRARIIVDTGHSPDAADSARAPASLMWKVGRAVLCPPRGAHVVARPTKNQGGLWKQRPSFFVVGLKVAVRISVSDLSAGGL